MNDFKEIIPFTEEEIEKLKKNKADKELWIRAFNYYNFDPKNKKLSIYCRPCYIKVLNYISKKK